MVPLVLGEECQVKNVEMVPIAFFLYLGVVFHGLRNYSF